MLPESTANHPQIIAPGTSAETATPRFRPPMRDPGIHAHSIGHAISQTLSRSKNALKTPTTTAQRPAGRGNFMTEGSHRQNFQTAIESAFDSRTKAEMNEWMEQIRRWQGYKSFICADEKGSVVEVHRTRCSTLLHDPQYTFGVRYNLLFPSDDWNKHLRFITY